MKKDKTQKDPAIRNRGIRGKIVFIMPAFILMVGVIGCFVMIPDAGGKVVWLFVEQLFLDPQRVIDLVCNPYDVLSLSEDTIKIRLFLLVWMVGLIVSLFFVGRKLHVKPELDSRNSLLVKKEPYHLVLDTRNALMRLKIGRSKQLASLVYAVCQLEERMFVESDFGYGDKIVIDCENDIARKILYLRDAVMEIEENFLDENIKPLNILVADINSLLRQRSELKKH